MHFLKRNEVEAVAVGVFFEFVYFSIDVALYIEGPNQITPLFHLAYFRQVFRGRNCYLCVSILGG
jgi:hypothetical protein